MVVLVVAAAGRAPAAAEVRQWTAMSGPGAVVRVFDGSATSEAGLIGDLTALSDRIGRDTHVRLVVRGPASREPWGCLPLADGCLPLLSLREWLRQERSERRAVIVEGGDPAHALALWGDGETAVAAFADGSAGAAAARKFWSARRDLDGDGALALRERFLAAAAPEAAASFIDPIGTTTWADAGARPRLPDDIAAPRDLAEVERLASSLQAGEWLALYLADRECLECEMTAFKEWTRMPKRRRGLRYAAIRDARAFAATIGRPLSLIEPTVAYYDRRGRLVGVADDATRPIAALPSALLPVDARRAAYESWLAGKDLQRAMFAAAALVQLDGGGEEPLIHLARRIHADSDPELVVAVLSALIRAKWLGTPAVPEVLSHIDHPETRVRVRALDALFALETDPGSVLCPLISAIPDPDAGIRERVRRLLFVFLRAVEPGVPAMATLLVHEDAAVRRAAVDAFAELNAGERAAYALPELARVYLSEEPDDVRRRALLAIVGLGAAAAPALPDLAARLVPEPDPESRALLAEALGQIGPPAACAREGLELLAREDVPLVRRKAEEALARVKPAP